MTFPAEDTELQDLLSQMSEEELLSIANSDQQEKGLTLESMSDEELEAIAQSQEPVETVNLNQSQQQPVTTSFMDMLFSPQQSAFEQGIGEVLRDIGVPQVVGPIELAKQFGGQAQQAFDPVAELFGAPTTDDLEKAAKQAGITQSKDFLTTENAIKVFDDLTENRFKDIPGQPGFKGKAKKITKEIANDFATLVNPLLPGRIEGLRAFGTAIIGSLLSEGLVDAGILDEKNKDAAKIGTWLLSSFVRGPSVKKAAGEFYGRAEKAIGDKIVTDNLLASELKSLKTDLAKAGGEVLQKNKPAIEMIDSLLKDVESGTFEGSWIPKSVRNVNRNIAEVGGPATRKGAELTNVRKVLQNLAERVGETNPEFLTNFNEANALWTALNTKDILSSFTANAMKKTLPKDLSNETLKLLGVAKIGKDIVKVGFKPVTQMVKVTQLMLTNPAAQRHYSKYLEAAAKGNTKAALAAIKELDREITGE